MPTSPADDPGEAERITKAYSVMLEALAERAELPKIEIERAGVSRQVIWRVMKHEEAKVRATMQKLRPDLSIPPPAVPVQDAYHFEWLELGTHLYVNHPKIFAQILERAKKAAENLIEAENREHRGLQGFADLARAGSGDPESE